MDQQTVSQNESDSEKDFQVQIRELVSEKEKIQEEFNIQRAKLKDLFLQKEAELSRKTEENKQLHKQVAKLKNELDDCKSQLVVDSITLESNFEVEKRKAEEEIATLQRLIHESEAESSSTRTLYDTELTKLETYIQQLQKEIIGLKREKNQTHHISQDHSSLASSQVLNVLTKGLKKLGADSFSSQESVDDSSKKTEEDAVVLRSLVEPLADQIKALKEKLRATDFQLQKCKECGHRQDETNETVDQSSQHVNLNATTSTNTSFESQKLSICDMCSNYEAELVKEQKKNSDLKAEVTAAEKAAERHKEELLKEIGFRKDMEEKWNEKKEEHKQQVAELTRATECMEMDLKELRQFFNRTCSEMKTSLEKLTHDRETIQQELKKLQKENDNLVGKYTVHSQELQSEVIDLPNTVEVCENEILGIEDTLELEIRGLKKQIDQLMKERKQIHSNQEKLVSSESLNQEKIKEQQDRINEFTETITSLEKQNKELRTRVISLQQELDTTETVQKDFVRLSQSLQVQLEKIRESDNQVRWQHEEDVEKCPTCHSSFSTAKRKQHCRHCGQIFCQPCLSHTVLSGPNSRPSKVCDVCHTLLVKSSAPYFSEAPPMT
nr:early endosome antigen 1 [Leptinotarsa decemlineata]